MSRASIIKVLLVFRHMGFQVYSARSFFRDGFECTQYILRHTGYIEVYKLGIVD